MKFRKPDYEDDQIRRWRCKDGVVVTDKNGVFFYGRYPDDVCIIHDPDELAETLIGARKSREKNGY